MCIFEQASQEMHTSNDISEIHIERRQIKKTDQVTQAVEERTYNMANGKTIRIVLLSTPARTH